MMKLLLIAVLTLQAGTVFADATHGQSQKCQFNNSTSCPITLTGVQAGSAIVVEYKSSVASTLVSASDGTNTYSTPVSFGSDPYEGYTYACNVAAGNPTITVSTSSAGFGGAVAYEVRTAAVSACVDVATNNQRQPSVGTGLNAVSSGLSGVPARSGSYILGFTGSNCCLNPVVTAGTGFTLDESIADSGSYAWSEHLEQGTAASIAATFTQNSGGGPTFHTLVLIVLPLGIDVGATEAMSATANTATSASVTTLNGSTFVVCTATDGTVQAPTDSKGNTYTAIDTQLDLSTNRSRCHRSENATGGASHTFTLNSTGATIISGCMVELKKPGATTIALHQFNRGTDATSPYVSPPITTTIASAVLVGFYTPEGPSGTYTHTIGNSFTKQDEVTNGTAFFPVVCSTRSVSSVGGYTTVTTTTGTPTNTANWLMAFTEGSAASIANFFRLRIIP